MAIKFRELKISELDNSISLDIIPTRRNYRLSEFLHELISVVAKENNLNKEDVTIRYKNNNILFETSNHIVLNSWNVDYLKNII